MALAQMIYHPLNSTANLFGTVHDRHPEIFRRTCPERTKWVEGDYMVEGHSNTWGGAMFAFRDFSSVGSKLEIDGLELRGSTESNSIFWCHFSERGDYESTCVITNNY